MLVQKAFSAANAQVVVINRMSLARYALNQSRTVILFVKESNCTYITTR
jgi:hypothetical protein